MMSHLQIADLTKKRQDNVKPVMDSLKDEGVIRFTEIQETSHDGAGARPIKVYYVNERDSHVVVARLSPAYTAYLVDFWMPACWRMTNRKPQFRLPQTFAEALRELADKDEQLQITTSERDKAWISEKSRVKLRR